MDTTTAVDFCLRLSRAATAMTRRFDAALGNHHGISFADYQLLRNLARAPEGRLRRVDLADRLGLTASGITRSLLPLEKIGLVGRQSDPRDARVGYAIITTAGAELVANADTLVESLAGDVVGDPPFAHLDEVIALLGQIVGRN
ncbi:MAG: MarR family winged helix-turn-helix transcriptional regulator [Telluria sp.]